MSMFVKQIEKEGAWRDLEIEKLRDKKESKTKTAFNEIFEVNETYFEKNVTLTQKIKVTNPDLKNIKDTSPDVVIINGPFLPINNEILKKGIIQYNLDFLNY